MNMKFYRLVRTEGGPLPEHPHLKVGAIVRIRPGEQLLEAVYNPDTHNWVSPRWVECEDPRKAAE